MQTAVQSRKGFTLIELLVVMAIIAILAVAMAVAFLRTSESARDTARKADLRNLATKEEEYFKDHQAYSSTLQDLVTGGYISSLPTDPKTGADYTYTPTGTPPTSFTISASLENSNDPDYPTFTVTNAQ